MLQSTARHLRHHWFKVSVWVLTALTALINLVLFQVLSLPDAPWGPYPDATQSLWFAKCSPISLYETGYVRTIYLGLSLLTVNALGWTIYHSLKLKNNITKKWQRTAKFLRKHESRLRIINALACALVMWLMLGIFTAYRSSVDEFGPKEGNENTQWTFGQVVALATWAPTILEFLTIFFRKSLADNYLTDPPLTQPPDGAEDGLSRKVSARYKVVSATPQEKIHTADHDISLDTRNSTSV